MGEISRAGGTSGKICGLEAAGMGKMRQGYYLMRTEEKIDCHGQWGAITGRNASGIRDPESPPRPNFRIRDCQEQNAGEDGLLA